MKKLLMFYLFLVSQAGFSDISVVHTSVDVSLDENGDISQKIKEASCTVMQKICRDHLWYEVKQCSDDLIVLVPMTDDQDKQLSCE